MNMKQSRHWRKLFLPALILLIALTALLAGCEGGFPREETTVPDQTAESTGPVSDPESGPVPVAPGEPCVVTFDTNGGNEIAPQTVESGKKIQKPDDPERTGYTFAGWTCQGEVWSFVGYLVTGDMTLVAEWTPNVYTLTFLPAPGKPEQTAEVTYDDGLPPITTPEREGYTFLGYFDETETENNCYYTADGLPVRLQWKRTEGLTLTARWKAITYLITYDLAGGTLENDPNPATYTVEEETVVFAGTPERDGYTFLGWSPATIGKGSIGDQTVTAIWSEPVVYPITYNLNGGVTDNRTGYTAETKDFSLSDATRDGYSFLGWTWEGQTEPVRSPTVPTGSTGSRSYTANWSAPIVYSITYDLAGGTLEDNPNPATYTVEDETVTLTGTPSKTGYSFTGWNRDTIVKGSYGDLTVTASWTPTVYTITYQLNGGTSGNRKSYTIETATFTLSNATRNGYTFLGWTWEGQTEPVKSPTVPTGSTGNRSYTANWSAPIVYSITYALAGGTLKDNPNPTKYTIKSQTIAITGTPTRDGYLFAGWNPAEIPSGSYGNVTVTATWIQVFRVSGSTITGLTQEGMKLSSLEIPKKINGTTVTAIGEEAFTQQSRLTSVTLPDSITTIGAQAFAYCAGLTEITIPGGVTELGASAFQGCVFLTSVAFGENSQLVSIGSYAFCDCTALNAVTIPAGVTTVGEHAFFDCTALTNILIPSSVTSIGNDAFAHCTKLTVVTFGDHIRMTEIGAYAFSMCSKLTTVTFGEDSRLSILGDHAFYSCYALTNISLPDGVTEIGEMAFYACSSMTSVSIPTAVTTFGKSAFNYDSSLTDISYAGTIAQWEAIVKEKFWNNNTGAYTVHCSDGDLVK